MSNWPNTHLSTVIGTQTLARLPSTHSSCVVFSSRMCLSCPTTDVPKGKSATLSMQEAHNWASWPAGFTVTVTMDAEKQREANDRIKLKVLVSMSTEQELSFFWYYIN